MASVIITCPQCNQPFSVWPSAVDRRTYCSRACKAAAMKGKPFFDSTGIPSWNKGVKGSIPSWNKGKTGVYSEDTLQRIREARARQQREHHPRWKGGHRYYRGYVMVYSPDHPHKNKNNCVPEHRLVMEQIIGRLLDPREVVHHINGIKDDNRPENLELFASNREHMKGHKGLGQYPRKRR